MPTKKEQGIGRAKTAIEQLKDVLFGESLDRPIELTHDHIESILVFRRARNTVFGEGLFSDPAWDILLALYAAHLEGRSVSLTELALSTDTPQSTAARWIVALEARGLVSTDNNSIDPLDFRIELSGKATVALKELADHWGSAFRSI